MKKKVFLAVLLTFVLVSCNQKNKDATTDSHMMEDNSHTMSSDSTGKVNETMMKNETKMYACPMHPEVQGELNDKCSKCGMKLTEPVTEK